MEEIKAAEILQEAPTQGDLWQALEAVSSTVKQIENEDAGYWFAHGPVFLKLKVTTR